MFLIHGLKVCDPDCRLWKTQLLIVTCLWLIIYSVGTFDGMFVSADMLCNAYSESVANIFISVN